MGIIISLFYRVGGKTQLLCVIWCLGYNEALQFSVVLNILMMIKLGALMGHD